MKLFIIALPNQKTSIDLLSRACEKNKLDYEILDPSVTCPCDINVAKNDMAYRVSDAYHYGCLELEYHLIEKGATSFYKNNSPFVMKEYCDVKSTASLIVLGDKVIDSIEYRANKGDFHSNEGTKPNTDVKEYDNATKELAVKATHALGLEFGEVDIMNTPDGPKVAEVNFPCFFPRCQMLTSVDIADKMIKYLMAKTAQKENN